MLRNQPTARNAYIERIRSSKMVEAVKIPLGQKSQLKPLAGIRAVVFDIYGTLISSGVGDISLASHSDRDASLRASLGAHGFQLDPASNGQPLDQWLHAIIEQHQAKRRTQGVDYPEVEIRRVWQDLVHQLMDKNWVQAASNHSIEACIVDYECRVNPTQAMPNLIETLAKIRDNGLTMSLVSNAQFYTEFLFDAWLDQSIQALQFSHACNVWSYQELIAKPSTQLYMRAADRLFKEHAIRANEVLYIGNDLRNDIWPAQIIGFKTGLFAGDDRSLRTRENDPDCQQVKPDLILTDLLQIIDCLA